MRLFVLLFVVTAVTAVQFYGDTEESVARGKWGQGRTFPARRIPQEEGTSESPDFDYVAKVAFSPERFAQNKSFAFPRLQVPTTRELAMAPPSPSKRLDGEYISVDEPVLIPWGKVQETGFKGSLYVARRYVLNGLDPNKSNFLLYPYQFSMMVENRTATYVAPSASVTSTSEPEPEPVLYNQTFAEGAFVDTEPTENLPDFNDYYFHYLLSHSSMDLNHAKAVYDSSIAVLQVTDVWLDGVPIDLTWESDYICTIFYSYIWGKYQKCFRGLYEWETYLANNPTTHEKVSIVFMSPENITASGLRNADGSNRFGMLIFPDIVEGSQDKIMSRLGSASSEITRFVNSGGLLYSSGKAALLVELLGLARSSTFDKQYTLSSTASVVAYGQGCNFANYAEGSEMDFVQRTVCFSVSSSSGYLYDALLSGAVVANPDPDYAVFAHWNTGVSWRPIVLHDTTSGLNSDLPAGSTHPMVMYKRKGQGQILLNLGNSPYEWNSYPWVYNAFLLANSKPLVLDNKIDGTVNGTIPGLETVNLKTTLTLKNYFPSDISGSVPFTVWYRKGLEVSEISSYCTVVTSNVPTPPLDILESTRCFDCSLPSLPALTTKEWMFSISIVDNLVTQAKLGITLLYPHLTFQESTTKQGTISYAVTVDAAMAALLRADMNIDPSSTYPFHARGSYIDNVMNCENKEETEALDVVHVSIVPLITPLIDINDQVQLAHHLEFDIEYYKQTTNQIMNYIFPFALDSDYDYLDFTRLCSRHNVLAASWDEAVKIFRIARDTVDGAGPSQGVDISSIMNANYQTNNENDFFLLKQHNFKNSDSYYEHATQRMMAFLDTWEPEAAATFYHNSIPADKKAVTKVGAAKRNVLFARHDIFFWKKYPQPAGIPDRNSVISMDRYPASTCTGDGPQSSKAIYAGVFSSSDIKGLIPQEWENELLLDCLRVNAKIDPADLESATDGQAQLTHYIVPISDPFIQVAEDMAGFSSTGEFVDYPEVKFVKPHQAFLDVAPENSRKGGEMVFTFSSDIWGGVDPIPKGWVTISADQIAIISTSYTANVLRIRFKRGNMPNEAYGQPSHLQIFLEGISSPNNITSSMDLYSLVYDIGDPANSYERWYDVKTVTGQTVKFAQTRALSLPAAKLTFRLPWENSVMKPYEFLEPFVRYGLYEQELLQHRAVHGSAEFHPINEPCLVTRNGGFSTFTHVGTSSVPFREFVNTGLSLIIPAAPETGRVEWTDVWGRRWVQPVRSTIFEYPPIPPPLRNFVMTTTFEILDHSGNLLTDWRSDDAIDVRVQMKLLNNYPKYFEITTCKANEVMQLCNEGNCEHSRLFDTDFEPPNFVVPTDTTDENQYIKIGHNASYGSCFYDPEVYLSGVHLSDQDRSDIQYAAHCAAILDDDDPLCEHLLDLPTVSRRGTDDDEYPWNYAKQVVDYYPVGYIKDIMWDMTHYDYDDTKYDKAYKYHMDNNLPHLGHWIPKTDNIISFPIFKGCGYKMTYDKTYSNPKFPGKQGWWSDNLQNKDHTLVAGQSGCSNISVGKPLLIADTEWVDIETLTDSSDLVQDALKNIYTCLFNRKRVKTHVDGQYNQYLTNVYENNVIPVPPSLSNNDLYNYQCTGTTQYTPDNISQFPNMVYTDSPRDWLYFAANLRGNALETINVLYQLQPLDANTIKYEGIAKVQDGGRFVYWNPANSRNSFLVHDNPVSTVFAIRNDLEVHLEVIPTYTTTFNALVFQHITVTDPAEINREWTSPIYIKHHGYGDFAISVYVGGNGGDCILQPGSRVRVKLTFSNNAGFDINLKATAIESSEIEEVAINSNDLMYNLKHTLMYPDKYNFMDIEVPDDLKQYITYEPCQDVVGIAPLFFDFDNINVATIRDGWKGDYYYWLTVASDLPDSFRGRLITLPMSLNRTYFDFFPGVGDPTGVHKYTVEMPPIVIGVPYASSHPYYAGKIFYTSGYATSLTFRHAIPNQLTPVAAYFVTIEDLDVLRMCLSGDAEVTCMEQFWNDLDGVRPSCPFTFTGPDAWNYLWLDYATGVATEFPTFPKKIPAVDGPDQAEFHILLKTTAPQLEAGYPVVSAHIQVNFLDWASKSKYFSDPLDMDVHSKGAWLTMTYRATLVSDSGLQLTSQVLYPTDNGNAIITASIRNSGDGMAYNPNITLFIPNNVTILTSMLTVPYNLSNVGTDLTTPQELVLFMGVPLSPGVTQSYTIRVSFTADTRDGAGPGQGGYLGGHMMVASAKAGIDLTETVGERSVAQVIPNPFLISYSSAERPSMVVHLTGKKTSDTTAELEVTHEFEQVRNYLWRYRAPDTAWRTFVVTQDQSLTVNIPQLWANITGTYRTDYTDPSIDFMVALTRDAYATVTSSPVVIGESNVWQWSKPKNSYLWLLLLIPCACVPALLVTTVFLKIQGTPATPAYTSMEPTSTSGAAAASTPKAKKPKKVKKAKRFNPKKSDLESGKKEEEEVARPGVNGPTYLMAGCAPVTVVDTKSAL